MPRVKIDYVVSFSSEDPEHPANNLLGWEVSKKKWICSRGEPSASVVLQLTKAVKISGVHIGVHHAALVEVLVGLSENPQQPFEVLVPRSVLLSPLESRREEGAARVRSFTGAALAGAAAGRWDRLRLVCEQPYNKRCKYGLSFVHIYESDGSDDTIPAAPSLMSEATPSPAAAPPSVAARLLNLETNSSDDDDFKPGELFRKQLLTNNAKDNTSTESQIRKATSQALRNINDNSTKIVKTPISKTKVRQDSKLVDTNHKDRQRDSLMYTDEDKRPNDKIDKLVQQHEKEKQDRDALDKNRNEKKQSSKETKGSAKEQKCSFKELNLTNNDSQVYKTHKERKAMEDPQSNRDPPQSSSKELKTSREDSQSSKKDPKSRDDSQSSRKEPRSSRGEEENSTSGHSKRDDRDSRKRPHKADKGNKDKVPLDSILQGVQFALSGYVNPQRAELRDAALALGARYSPDYTPACTHLICAFPNTPKLKAVRAQSSEVVAVRGEWLLACRRARRRLPWQPHATEPQHRTQISTSDGGNSASDSECDTDDEIEKVRQQQKKIRTDEPPSPKAEQAKRSSDVRNVSSDSDVAFVRDERFQGQVSVLSDSGDETAEEAAGDPVLVVSRELPDLFQGCTFAVDEKVAEDGFDPLLLARYIKAYGGELVQPEHIDKETGVDYYLCTRGPAQTAGLHVAPDWLWQCHELQTKCATDDYLL